MNCLADIKIEKYVLGADSLSDEQREHLLLCDRCRERYSFLKELYREQPANEIPFPHERRRGSAPRTIVLHPLEPHSPTEKTMPRLAAQTSSEDEKYTVYHFSNKEQDIVGRLLRDKSNGHVSLHLLASKAENTTGQKIRLVETDLEAFTDERGIADFGVLPELEYAGIQIESPLAVFELSPHIIDEMIPSQSHIVPLSNKNHDEIEIEISQENKQTQYRISIVKMNSSREAKELRVLAFTNERRVLEQKTKGGLTVFETDDKENILKIHIF